MPLTPEADHALYADETGVPLEAQLEAALARNTVSRLAVEETTSLASIALAAVSEALLITPTNQSAQFGEVPPTLQDVILSSHFVSEELLGSVGIEMPAIADFEDAGTKFKILAAGYEVMTKLGLEPEVVFAPVLLLKQWRAVYKSLQDNPRVNTDGHIQNGGLSISPEIEESWDGLQDTSNSIHINGQDWQVSVMPATPRSPIVNIDHAGKSGLVATNSVQELLYSIEVATGFSLPYKLKADHPTIASYLTLQATRLYTLEPPLDSSTSTWLHGAFTVLHTMEVAPCAYSYNDGPHVHLTWAEVATREINLGMRLPIRGTT